MINKANNVVSFPKQNNRSKDKSIEEVQNNINMVRHYHIQETIASIAPIIFNQLEVAGFVLSEDDEDEENLKDGAFLVESLRSIMCKYYGIYHPFQQIAESVFIPDDEEDGALRIVETLNLALIKESKI
jgi:hypothetical protein